MKKVLSLLAVICLTIVLVACQSGPTLRLYNWGEYISDDLLDAFEEEYGVRVRQITFDSNEVAITQIKGGNQYDLVIPSDYAIEQLAKEGLIEAIDWSRITTLNPDTDLAAGLDLVLENLAAGANGFDLLEYGVPYFWGNLGILYDTNTVDEDDLTGWDALTLNEKYRIAFYNSSRDSFLPALKATGAASVNNPTQTQINMAIAWLNQYLTRNVDVITDDLFNAMVAPARYDLAVTYSGDANYLMGENEDLGFFVPSEGTNVFVDALVIPKGANLDYAYDFINFISSYENALANTEEIGYSTPRQDVLDAVLAPDGAFEGFEESYDVRFNASDEVYRYNTELKLTMDTQWQSILASKGYDDDGLGIWTYVAIGAVVVLVLSSFVIGFIKKRKKAV